MDEAKWIAWEIQTSKRWSDMEDVLMYTNIDFIDYDHKMLVEYALKLNQVLDRSEIEFSMGLIQETKGLLDNLYSYAKGHFEREEHFMDTYRLPEVKMHKREHDKILDMLKVALDNFNSGKLKLSKKLKAQLMDWLIKHINSVDYYFFDISNWSQNIINATDWNEIKPIICLIGINDIDNQHQEMTEIALKTMKNISLNPTEEVVEDSCMELIEYAKYHFAYEAEFMTKYGIQESKTHLEQHGYFIQKLSQYSADIRKDFTQIEGMKEWLLKWWINHINSVDKNYFAYRNWAYQLIEQAENLEDIVVVLRKTGIKEIDEDHLILMGLTMELNKLIQLNEQNEKKRVKDGDVREQVLINLDKTYQYTVFHFEREEKIMADNNMDDLISHRTEHEKILRKLRNVKENYLSGRLYLSENIKTMILEWWIQHTNTTDFRTFVQNFKVLAPSVENLNGSTDHE